MPELKRALNRAFSRMPYLIESSCASAGAHVLCFGLARTSGLQATFTHKTSHVVGYLCESPPVDRFHICWLQPPGCQFALFPPGGVWGAWAVVGCALLPELVHPPPFLPPACPVLLSQYLGLQWTAKGMCVGKMQEIRFLKSPVYRRRFLPPSQSVPLLFYCLLSTFIQSLRSQCNPLL